jgi:DNA-binding CsgD family transcriptional regulator
MQKERNKKEKRKKELPILIKISKEIAEKFYISANTFNNHRSNVIEKLNVSNSSKTIKLAQKLEIFELFCGAKRSKWA